MKGLYSRNNYVQCFLGNCQYGGDHKDFHKTHFCKHFEKEYEISTLIFNRKTWRLDLLYFCAPEDIIHSEFEEKTRPKI